jgi:hypothetical protein
MTFSISWLLHIQNSEEGRKKKKGKGRRKIEEEEVSEREGEREVQEFCVWICGCVGGVKRRGQPMAFLSLCVYLTLDSSQFAGSTYHVVLFHST